MASIKIKLFGFVWLVLLAGVWAKQVVVANPDGTTATFTTIQAAIDVCQPGGTVTIFPGIHTKTTYINKNITLIVVRTPMMAETSCI